MILSPGLQADEVDGDDPFFPKATIPPVKVTFEETITFAGSDTPETITAWMLEGAPVGAEGVEGGTFEVVDGPEGCVAGGASVENLLTNPLIYAPVPP